MSKFEEWVKLQRSVGTAITYLEIEGDAKLVQTQASYLVGGVTVALAPRYYIWIGDKLYKNTSNYGEAYKIWNMELCCKAM